MQYLLRCNDSAIEKLFIVSHSKLFYVTSRYDSVVYFKICLLNDNDHAHPARAEHIDLLDESYY